MSTNQYFQCGKAGCKEKIFFDIKKVNKKFPYKIKCSKCQREWVVTIEGVSCCAIHAKFASIENNGSSIIRRKVYSKS
jgi:hypothetical protein